LPTRDPAAPPEGSGERGGELARIAPRRLRQREGRIRRVVTVRGVTRALDDRDQGGASGSVSRTAARERFFNALSWILRGGGNGARFERGHVRAPL
jgi:hypothetical protein